MQISEGDIIATIKKIMTTLGITIQPVCPEGMRYWWYGNFLPQPLLKPWWIQDLKDILAQNLSQPERNEDKIKALKKSGEGFAMYNLNIKNTYNL